MFIIIIYEHKVYVYKFINTNLYLHMDIYI